MIMKGVAGLVLALVLLLGPANAQQSDYIISKAYLEDPTGRLDFADVIKEPLISYEGMLTKGFTASVF